ncbi:MAG: signal recognition particle-docking protein FtsY [Candidatus Eisenbacteria bacterium]|uniref:Signal recognition particle-docking protein FtsY n=1 Tax=Eiseniibacteriota bacterium TaxID=2212470 RepID=A0A849T1W4_UNCEI|nr:signal recognition particle-docking protein FtsY [Candidatus Eisenbacteria bacterium]
MGLWERLRSGLTRTREQLVSQVGAVLGLRGPIDPQTLEPLEDALLLADVGPATVERLIASARDLMGRDRDLELGRALELAAIEILGRQRLAFEPGPNAPWVALIVGVNGVGKTTLAGKLAASFARDGRRTLLVAGDTFRAAASDQLAVWAERAGVELVRARDLADPAAVVHDGLSAALARGTDVVLIDTAGRLHTKQNLMAELQKVRRVCERQVPGAPHHTLLVLDANLGQNGIAQAREFQKVIPITSLAINKLDGTARGGAVLAIADQLGLPVSLTGLGEGLEDWERFDPEAFARGLFSTRVPSG